MICCEAMHMGFGLGELEAVAAGVDVEAGLSEAAAAAGVDVEAGARGRHFGAMINGYVAERAVVDEAVPPACVRGRIKAKL